MVKVSIKELSARKCRLLIEEASPYLANSLRRVLLAEVPKLAIQDVVIYDNNSGLFDEMVAHRVGLLPVPTDLNLMSFRDQCTCAGAGCANCTVRFTLSKEGPALVTAKDLQPEQPQFAIADPDIPIVELLKGQRLILEAEAIMGRGREHSKWQPVSGVGYRYAPTVRNVKDHMDALAQAAKAVAVDVPKLARGKDALVDEDGILALSDAALRIAEEKGVPVRWDETRFQFKFETDGSLTAKTALLKAVEILKNRLNEFEEKTSKLKVVATEAA